MTTIDELIAAGRDPLEDVFVTGAEAIRLRDEKIDIHLKEYLGQMPQRLREHLQSLINQSREQALREAVAEERKRDAKIAASFSTPLDINNPTLTSGGGLDVPMQIAAAILEQR